MSSEVNSTSGSSLEGESKSSTVILFLSFSVLSACICEILLSKILKNKIPLPFTVAVLLLGFIIGIIITQTKHATNDFAHGEIQLSEIDPHIMYYVFLPLLIFDSSFNGHFHVIKQQLFSAILLAGPGVLISTVIIAICGIYIFPYNWSWLVGLMFGSILSATDPIAVVALLHDSGASKSLASLIDSESLLNDGSAFVMFLIFHNIIVGESHSAKDIIIEIIKYSIGGPAFGLACGIISVIILNRINNKLEVEITFTLGIAYLVFYIADVELGVSAVLALVTMGLYMSKYKYCISSNVQPSLASVWRIATYFINILVFTITGIVLARSFIGTTTNITIRDFGFSLVLYIIMHVGRVITIVILYPLIKCTGVYLSWKDCTILAWSGLRGSMALILVLIVTLNTEIDNDVRERFFFHVSMIVLLTLIVNGTSCKFIVKLLGLHHRTKESELILLQALEHMRTQTSWKLSTMKQDEKFIDVDWKILNEYLPDKLLEELDEENNTTFHLQLSSEARHDSPTYTRQSPRQSLSTEYQLEEFPTTTTTTPDTPEVHDEMGLPIFDIRNIDENFNENIRSELILRFLTAISIDYEKQWYLGMIRRKSLDILIKSIEQAKQKVSFKIHWQLIERHFQLSTFLRLMKKFGRFGSIDRMTNRLFFNHIFQTIELTLSFHSAKTRLDKIRSEFPELTNINERILNEVYKEVKLYQTNAMNILRDLQRSYRPCWIIQMTLRCAQMILKYESVAIIQLYETGMLNESEYSHILELIESKLYSLEYGHIQMPENQTKILRHPFDFIPFFQTLSSEEKHQWKTLITPKHDWLQPGTILLQSNQRVPNAYLIIRGIVQCVDNIRATYYSCGNIVGIDSLFSEESPWQRICTAHGGLVEVYLIDAPLLNLFLGDEKISRSIYDEIVFHMIINNYQKSSNLNHLQLKMLLSNAAIFYKNQADLSIDLEENHRLFLLSGTIEYHANTVNSTIHSIQLISHQLRSVCRLNSSSIVYTWTQEDEISCLNSQKLRHHMSNENSQHKSAEPFYPLYIGKTSEFSPRLHSSLMTRPIENSSNFQFIPTEIEVPNEHKIVGEFMWL